MISTQSNFLKKIKAETKAAHEHIEQNYLMGAIVNQSILKNEYIELLKRFLSFYSPCEAQLNRLNFWQKNNLSLNERYKSPLLHKDLKYLRISELEINTLRVCQDIPVLRNDAQILGYLYVVEGATLGGQLLSKQLSERFGFGQQAGAAFFSSYGKAKLGLMWKNFQNILENFINAFPEEESMVIRQANLTFTKLDHCLSK